MSSSPATPSSERAPSDDGTWRQVGGEDFVQLTTFRKTGAGVPTPVWVVPDGDALLVTTPAGSGKLKRLRHTPRVEMQPCSRRGSVPDGAPTVSGTATVDPGDHAHAAVEHLFAAKYGTQYRVVMVIEKAVRAVRRRSGTARRIIRITPA